MSFRFEKLYADLVASDGTVCVVYVTALRWGALRHSYAGAEIFTPDGGRETVRAAGDTSKWLIPETAAGDEIRFPCETGTLRLRYQRALEVWRPQEPPPAEGLAWWVDIPRATGELWWPGEGERRLEGLGYADRVRLDRPLRRMGMATLEWGRIHLRTATVVYTGLALGRDRRWRRAARWSDGHPEPQVWQDFELAPDGDKRRFQPLPEAAGSGLVLAPHRQIHRGLAVEAAPDPKRRDRALSRLIAGRLADDRWLSRAESLDDPSDTGWAVHELVDRR